MGSRVGSRLHDDEVEITLDLVRRFIESQFPQYAHLPIRPVGGLGTVNLIFRLGDELSIRLPRSPDHAKGIACERECLPLLEGKLPLRIPRLVGSGSPTSEYPCEWSINDWIIGEPYSLDEPPNERDTARLLGNFVHELQRIEPTGPPSTRDTPLADRDELARTAISRITEFEQEELTEAWQRGLAAPAFTGDPVWIHADLLPPNLLVHEARLAAVLDFGHPGIGDPALDFGPAWTILTKACREDFREAVSATPGDWERARGFALFQALLIIPYYRDTNPGFAATAIRTISEILGDI